MAVFVRREHTGMRQWYFVPVLILLSLVVLDHIALHPRLLINLAGIWQACTVEGPTAQTFDWKPVTVPAHYVPDDSSSRFTGWMRFKNEFAAPAECFEHTCRLVIGEVGDAAVVYLNGQLLHQDTPGNLGYEKNIPVAVALPPFMLHQHDVNRVELLIHTSKMEQSGISHGPVAITQGSDGLVFLLWKTFRSIGLPLACSMAAAAIALLVSTFPLQALSISLRRAFYRYAALSSLFLFSFSELPRNVLPISISVPAHFLLRFGSDWALCCLICAFYMLPEKPTRS